MGGLNEIVEFRQVRGDQITPKGSFKSTVVLSFHNLGHHYKAWFHAKCFFFSDEDNLSEGLDDSALFVSLLLPFLCLLSWF